EGLKAKPQFPEHELAFAGNDDRRDCRRQPLPVSGLRVELLAALPGDGVELDAPFRLAHQPLRRDPAFLLQLVKRRIQGAWANLKALVRHLFQPLRQRPPMHRLERQDSQDEKTECALNEVVGFHESYRCPIRVYQTPISLTRSPVATDRSRKLKLPVP